MAGLLIILAVVFVVGIIIVLPAGQSGEDEVNDIIKYLSRNDNEFHVFSSVILKSPDGTTQIDHLVISPYGIFVIETKSLKGWIFGGAYQRNWTQSLKRGYSIYSLFNKYTFQFQNPIHQNYKHVKAVQNFFRIGENCVFSIIVFAGPCEFKSDMPHNVIYSENLPAYLKSFSDRILNVEQVERFSKELEYHIEHSSITESDHIQNITNNLTNPVCPQCGKRMILRTARKGPMAGSNFWGCPNFPSCKITRNVVGNMN